MNNTEKIHEVYWLSTCPAHIHLVAPSEKRKHVKSVKKSGYPCTCPLCGGKKVMNHDE